MLFRNKKTGAYPCTDMNIRMDNPNTSFGEIMTKETAEAFGYEEVFQVDAPNPEPLCKVEPDGIEPSVGGLWKTKWKQVPLTDIEIADIRNSIWNSIKIKRDKIKFSGVKVGDKWFHTDDSSRIQQLGLVMMGTNLPSGLQWKTMDGTFVTMTKNLAMSIFQAVAGLDQAAFASAETHRISLQNAEDPRAYDFSSGWPIVYSEQGA